MNPEKSTPKAAKETGDHTRNTTEPPHEKGADQTAKMSWMNGQRKENTEIMMNKDETDSGLTTPIAAKETGHRARTTTNPQSEEDADQTAKMSIKNSQIKEIAEIMMNKEETDSGLLSRRTNLLNNENPKSLHD